MKSDIEIPEVKDVYVAVIREWDEEMLAQNWYAYVINDRNTEIEMVIVVTKGYDQDRKTSMLRHGLNTIAAKSSGKIEMVQDEVLAMNNQFVVTFFADGKLYDKTYLFRKNTINEGALRDLPVMERRGVLAP